MQYFLHFGQLCLLYILIPLIVLLIWLKRRYYKPITYQYSVATRLYKKGAASSHPYKKIFYILRLLTLLLLSLLIAKPRVVDSRSKALVEGIDIVLVLDMSGSMQYQDFDERSRFDVAKQEAIRFISKRKNDAIGLVVFGKDAVSRCPITLDKPLLKNIVDELNIGVIDADGTMLITGMITAVNRLKHSKAKSKIMIVLTDGEPTEGDLDPSVAIEVANELGIKIYTVGIGSEKDEMLMSQLYGIIPKLKVNKKLLTSIAEQTGGRYFMAHNAHDMRQIYDTIDQLEKIDHEVPVFSSYYDIFIPFTFTVIGLVTLEIILSSFIWFAL